MKTTARDFAYFGSRCQHWIAALGLTNWHVAFRHEPDDSVLGAVHMNRSSRQATIVLAAQWPDRDKVTDRELDRVALHEVLHILLAPLEEQVIERTYTRTSWDSAEHDIVRRLENLLAK